jgi:hypothetical protein
MRGCKLVLCSAIMVAVAWSTAAAEIAPRMSDGWHTWQVDESGVSSEMCCFTWRNGNTSRDGCHLDNRSISFTSGGDCAAAPGTVQVYVKFENSGPKDIRVLSSNCPVSSESEILSHGLVSANENLDWFRDVIESDDNSQDLREEALFGLVQSGGDAAYVYLDRLLSWN